MTAAAKKEALASAVVYREQGPEVWVLWGKEQPICRYVRKQNLCWVEVTAIINLRVEDDATNRFLDETLIGAKE